MMCPHCNVSTEPRNERGEYDDVFGVQTCPACGWSQPEVVEQSHTWIFADGRPLQASVDADARIVRFSHSHAGYQCPCHLIDSDGNEKYTVAFFYHGGMP